MGPEKENSKWVVRARKANRPKSMLASGAGGKLSPWQKLSSENCNVMLCTESSEGRETVAHEACQAKLSNSLGFSPIVAGRGTPPGPKTGLLSNTQK